MKTTPHSQLVFRICLTAFLFLTPLVEANAKISQPPRFAKAHITIQTMDGREIPYSVEVAITPYQHEYGLMFRRSMPKQSGMLFLFNPDSDPAKGAAFWMKNTKISLDMIFVRDDGTINEIHARAVPEDLTPIMPAEPAHAVIEINGGEAERLNIKAGDKVVYPGLGAP